MGFKFDGFVGTNTLTDGSARDVPLRFGRDGSLVVYENHGKFYEAAVRGNAFVATSATPIAIIVSATTGGSPLLWNPHGSGVILEIVKLQLTKTITTPDAPSAFTWNIVSPAGADIATGGPIATATNIPPTNMLLGSGRVSKAKYSQATNTFTVLPPFFMGAGISQSTWTAISTYPPMLISVDYDGMLVIPPNVALALCATVASGGTYFVNIFYIESAYSGAGV